MTVFEFIASLVGSIAWPLVVALGIIAFRKTIVGLITSILKISHNGTEVVFDRAAREVEAAIAVASLPEAERNQIDATIPIATTVGRIAMAWHELEELIRQRLIHAGLGTPSGLRGDVLRAAQQHDLITADQARALLGLRSMRNLAVHGRSSEIDETRVEEFLTLADAMKVVLSMAEPL